MPFTNPAYLIDTSTAPVFADIAVDSDDNALIVVSTGTQLDLYHYTGSDTPTKTTLESATVWSGIGVSLDLNRFDHAVVSCYSEDAGGGEVRFLTEAARGLSISGTVSDFTLAALPGVSLSLSGNIDNKSVLSDGVGAYSFGDLFEGHYTVTPSFSGYAFVPPSISLNSMMVNKPGQDFKGSLVDLDTQGNLIDPTKGEFVTFNYSVVPGHVSFIVYNLRGTHIKTLLDEDMGAVSSSVTWDGKDSNGEIVASGIYLFRFKSYQFEQKGKVAVVK
jgi:hypothetical protein